MNNRICGSRSYSRLRYEVCRIIGCSRSFSRWFSKEIFCILINFLGFCYSSSEYFICGICCHCGSLMERMTLFFFFMSCFNTVEVMNRFICFRNTNRFISFFTFIPFSSSRKSSCSLIYKSPSLFHKLFIRSIKAFSTKGLSYSS